MSVVKNIEIENQNYDIYGKNIQPVTWQEYEAIEDKNDDKAYFITDVPPSEQKKTAVKPLPTGAISTVTDAASLPLNALKVSVEAVQDLHGYDHPWAGGAGKNKLPLVLADIKTLNTSGTWSGDEYTISGVTFTILTDSNGNVTGVSVNGTATKNITFLLTNTNGSWMTDGTTYKINGSVGGSYNTWSIWVQGHGTYQSEMSLDGDGTFTYTAGRSTSARISVDSGVSLSNQMFRPMIRLATESDPTFEPYSNICPIEGWDSGEINVVGKNWFDGIWLYGLIDSETGEVNASNDVKFHDYMRVIPSTQYIFSAYNVRDTYNPFQIFGYDKNKTYIGTISIQIVDNTTSLFSEKFTIPANVEYVRMHISSNSLGSSDKQQLEYGDVVTTYEPYQGKQYTQQFPQTIYGAEWDVVDGGMNNTYRHIIVPNNITVYANPAGWNPHYPSYYFSISELGIIIDRPTCISNAMLGVSRTQLQKIDKPLACAIAGRENEIDFTADVSTPAEAKQLLLDNGIEFLYELKIPTTIDLNPLSIRMLEGTNNVYADCGEVIEGEYFGNNTNQIRVNDEIIAGGNSVTFAAESKYAEHAEVADNACTFSVDENGLLTISLVSGDSNNSLSSTRSVKSTTILPPEEEITNEKSEEEEVKDESAEEPVEEESEIVEEKTDETEEELSENKSEESSVEEEKDNDDGGEETPPEQNIR